MPVKYTQNKLILIFNHHRDIGASGKCRKGLAENKAALGGYMSTEHPVIAWSSEIGIANLLNKRYLYK